MTTCYELVVYRLKSGVDADFEILHAQIRQSLAQRAGFIGFETDRHIQDPQLRVDRVFWKNRKSAMDAFHAFKTTPHAKPLMTMVEQVLFSGHFNQGHRSIISD